MHVYDNITFTANRGTETNESLSLFHLRRIESSAQLPSFNGDPYVHTPVPTRAFPAVVNTEVPQCHLEGLGPGELSEIRAEGKVSLITTLVPEPQSSALVSGHSR